MKNKIAGVTAFFLVLALFSSCSPLKVTFSSVPPKPIDKIVLISTFLRLDKPVLPLLDAAVMNEKTNSNSEAINSLFQENIDIMRDSAANILKSKLKCEVIYGDELHAMPGFKELKTKYNFDNALITKDDHFPEIITAKEDINPFDFKGQKIEKYFETYYNYTRTIAGISKALDVNYVAVSLTLLKPSPGDLFISATLSLVNHIYVFDKNGNCIAQGENVLPFIKIEPYEVEGYQEAIDTYSETLRPIVVKMAEKYGK